MRKPVKPLPGYPRQRPLETAEELAEYTHGTPTYLVCLLCGGMYRGLANHLHQRHGVEPDAYRARYGLRWTVGLSCQTTLLKNSAHTTALMKAGVLKPRWSAGDTRNLTGPKRPLAPAVRARVVAASIDSTQQRKPRQGLSAETVARMDARNARVRARRAARRAAAAKS